MRRCHVFTYPDCVKVFLVSLDPTRKQKCIDYEDETVGARMDWGVRLVPLPCPLTFQARSKIQMTEGEGASK